MQIRNVRESDFDPIISVLDTWWGGRNMAAMLPKLFFKHFNETSFTAEVNGDLAGFLIGFISNTHLDEAYIHFLGVHPDHRKNGIGQALYERFFEICRQKKKTVIRSVTSPVNQNSIAFHQHLGFEMEPAIEQSGDIPVHRNYDGPGEDRVLFIKRL